MISSWIAKTTHSEKAVKVYLAYRKELTKDKVDGDPDWGLMFDQIIRHRANNVDMIRVMTHVFDTLIDLREGG